MHHMAPGTMLFYGRGTVDVNDPSGLVNNFQPIISHFVIRSPQRSLFTLMLDQGTEDVQMVPWK